MRNLFLLLILIVFASCSSSDDGNNNVIDLTPEELYFPPLNSDIWETVSPTELGWNDNQIQPLLDYLEEKNTKGFIILKNGKIIIERYFNGHSQNANWEWYSAVKSLTATAIGVAQDEDLLNINNNTSDYLGNNWSSLTQEKQDLITVRNHLTMTTGLQNTPLNFIAWTCTTAPCMIYSFDAGFKWQYHQGAFTQVQNIISQSTGVNFKVYIKEKILNQIGVAGSWNSLLNLNIFSSNTRGMARFGLLALNKGTWSDNTIVSEAYFNEMTNTSQNLNKSYGYLWWLNGKDGFTGTDTIEYPGSLIPNGSDDMLCALGAQDQKIYVIPSKNLVVVRCGEAAGLETFANSSFDNELWGKINAVIN